MENNTDNLTASKQKKESLVKSGISQTGLTPLMQQYRDIKADHPDAILFFRLGDFYEMFGQDAVKASALLDLVLTKRQNVPMCGIPFHSTTTYIKKLVKAGEKVAICEQLEEPGQGKGIVRRGVVRIITPGTLLEDNLLDAKTNNYLVSLAYSEKEHLFGIACVDISTGEFLSTEISKDKLKNELFRLNPGEIVVPDSLLKDNSFAAFMKQRTASLTPLDDWFFTFPEASSKLFEAYRVQSLKPLGLENKNLAVSACGGAIAYLEKTNNARVPSLNRIKFYSTDEYMLLDETAIKNLELIEGSSSGSKADSLLDAIDRTLTPMGGRTLRQWLIKPLLSVEKIVRRQQAVEFFVEDGLVRRNVREHLNGVADIERILSRLSSGSAGPKELVALKNSLLKLSDIAELVMSNQPGLKETSSIKDISKALKTPSNINEIITQTLNEDPPAMLKDGGVIRSGYSAGLDELRTIRRDSKNMISEMEQNERRKTGINSLKIGYTSVFGYYIEISKSNLHLASSDYIRKQTVASGERFITPELKAFEEKILSAEEKILKLEETIYKELAVKILGFSEPLLAAAAAAAELDIYSSFAETSALCNFIKPEIGQSFELDIKDGRHPVVERKIKSGSFVSNDMYLNGESERLILLTGPNMAGKSTYLRQNALIVILAQAGSYVPCSSARIGLVDRIFTRIGAGDNLTGGESTFMVEMHETANILSQYTSRSLLILDEVGRGTSTYDGISIAWAVIEFLAKAGNASSPAPKVLFATHYFELTDLEGKIPGIKNFNVSVREWKDEVVFLHKIVPGAADRSYGIHVAKLAGLPDDVIKRAYGLLNALEQKPVSDMPKENSSQLDFFAPAAPGCRSKNGAPGPGGKGSALPSSKILVELDKLDIDGLTPLEALQILARLKKMGE